MSRPITDPNKYCTQLEFLESKDDFVQKRKKNTITNVKNSSLLLIPWLQKKKKKLTLALMVIVINSNKW